MNKKGVELSMNLIIIAAIGLLVLVILAVLVIGSGTKTQDKMRSCNLQGGTCETSCLGKEPIPNGDCSSTPSKPLCCKVFSTG
jgi:hypothetical protein